MTHTHKFKEIPRTALRDKRTTKWICLECRAVYAVPSGQEYLLNGEILEDEEIDGYLLTEQTSLTEEQKRVRVLNFQKFREATKDSYWRLQPAVKG